MKNIKTNKILLSVLCFAMILTLSASVLAATNIGGVTIDPATTTNGANSVGKLGNNVIGIIQVAGILIAVGVLMVLGIKYMMGSAEEKAEYKKTFIPYIIGAILLFAAAALANTIYGWAQSIGNTI